MDSQEIEQYKKLLESTFFTELDKNLQESKRTKQLILPPKKGELVIAKSVNWVGPEPTPQIKCSVKYENEADIKELLQGDWKDYSIGKLRKRLKIEFSDIISDPNAEKDFKCTLAVSIQNKAMPTQHGQGTNRK